MFRRYRIRKDDLCILCLRCAKECSFGAITVGKDNALVFHHEKCTDCQRCVSLCPRGAIYITEYENRYRGNSVFKQDDIDEILLQADTGGVLLSSMGASGENVPIYFDKMLLNASQVTNPSIDPLREPMETSVFIGARPGCVERTKEGRIMDNLPPHLELKTPILFSAMSYGAISLNVHRALAIASERLGTYWNTGEGGLHESLYPYKENTIVQVASGRFGVHATYLNTASAIEIKIGQGAKPGIGGHLTGKKIIGDVSKTRMVPEGLDAISPAPHHDIYSIEDLAQLVMSIKEATEYKRPVIVKVAAVHNIAPIASGIARSGADIIAIDGYRGGTGAAPKRIRDNVGIPIELAIATVDQRLREERIRDRVSIIASGGIRNSSDVVKAIALGSDAVSIGTAALCALGCHICASCHTGRCAWGLATQDPELTGRLDPEKGAERLINLVNAWTREIKEIMGGMGINSIEALRGNRMALKGVGLNSKELEILGIGYAGE
ncbi:MAG TPA: alpha-hydroxy-acid oxidizing protein [Candidatus Ornithospirochaeta stercorigallinarum]|nr:alpha-hydroxy-acid oxidizing protein [Candidatus Ornithospirochaeta stercorigallinarum]